jgi:predicted nucleotide-binding protein
MSETLDAFLAAVPSADVILGKHSEAVALFGFFLSEIEGQDITPTGITECYGAAHMKAPKNMSDTMSKSHAFVRSSKGWTLQRDTLTRLKSCVRVPTSVPSSRADEERQKIVMVVYGRDEETRLSMFNFLRTLHLFPIEWNDAVTRTGKSSPYIGEILKAAFSMAQAFLVLMTPDEQAVLRPELCKAPHDGDVAFQPRPNVILEAGMALATDEARTILVSTGSLRGISDLDGRHVIRLDNSPDRRNDLIQRLKIAGCDPKSDGTDWIRVGAFERFK